MTKQIKGEVAMCFEIWRQEVWRDWTRRESIILSNALKVFNLEEELCRVKGDMKKKDTEIEELCRVKGEYQSILDEKTCLIEKMHLDLASRQSDERAVSLSILRHIKARLQGPISVSVSVSVSIRSHIKSCLQGLAPPSCKYMYLQTHRVLVARFSCLRADDLLVSEELSSSSPTHHQREMGSQPSETDNSDHDHDNDNDNDNDNDRRLKLKIWAVAVANSKRL